MNYSVEKACEILEKTPGILRSLFSGLSPDWTMCNEGPDTFSPYDVIGHLIHGEQTDWVVRAKHILAVGTATPFEPWDRFAQFKNSKGKTLEQLLSEFELLRQENINWLKSARLSEADLEKEGVHPVLGRVTLRNLLSTWVVHDLTHLAQITRVMAKQYQEEIGPWKEFFRILSF
ncbi:MAG: DinB family protein [Chitinophagales bacterium]|nr:DinB family protein [Chitinophagales bacterium]